jgi:predicted transcriptional regulator
MATTIQLQPKTKNRLDDLKVHPRETYDDVLNRLLDIAYDPEPLSEETLKQIEEGIADIRAGRYRSLEDVARELDLE